MGKIEKKPFKMPHLLWIMFGIIVLACLATCLITAGEFAVFEEGQITGTDFHFLGHQPPVSPWGALMRVKSGMVGAATIAFVVMISGANINVVLETGVMYDLMYWGVYKLKDIGTGILVSMMMVNNEIGAVEPIAEAAKIVIDMNPNTIIHVDAIQAYGKYRICPKKLGIDLLSVSGHKIHAPKGTGYLYIKDKTKIKPIIYGGGQQKGMRSGTENVPGAAALGEAAMEIYENFDEKIAHMYALKKHFIEEVTKIEGVTINGKTGEDSAPQIVSVTIQGVRSEVMQHSLEEKEIYVSAGSACSSNPAGNRTEKSGFRGNDPFQLLCQYNGSGN